MNDQPKPAILKCPYCGCKALHADALTMCCSKAIRETPTPTMLRSLSFAELESAKRECAKEIAAERGAKNHMEACRALLKVPDDEVLYVAIEELQKQLAAEREKVETLVDALKKAKDRFRKSGWPEAADECEAALAKVKL